MGPIMWQALTKAKFNSSKPKWQLWLSLAAHKL